MRKYLWIVALVVAGAGIYFLAFRKEEAPTSDAGKQKPLAQSKHSASFNAAVSRAMEDYSAVSESYVNWDSAGLGGRIDALQASLDALAFEELRKDTAIYETAVSYKENFRNDLAAMRQAPNLTESRRSFHSLSQNVYDLLRTIRYDASPVYLQECPMAFNDQEAAVWLSKTSAVRNPYLGLYHPRYKAGMLNCGEPKDSLQFGKKP